MPQDLFPWEFEPVENRRKKYIQQGGLGGPMDGHKNPRELQQHRCTHCGANYTWISKLDFTDFGDVIDNLCEECRIELRKMRTNHPPIG